MENPPPLKPTRVVLRGLTRRCPLCGRRGTFASWFHLRARCPTCNYPTNRVDDQWIGALGINTMVTFSLLVVVIAISFVATYPDPPIGVIMALTLTIAAATPILFYPVSKSLWSAIDMAMRPPEPGDDIDPRFLPPGPREVGGVIEPGDTPPA